MDAACAATGKLRAGDQLRAVDGVDIFTDTHTLQQVIALISAHSLLQFERAASGKGHAVWISR